jgi:hypothetical protein
MTTNSDNPLHTESGSGSAEETLRFIAALPAPAGIEGRMHAALQAARQEDSRRQIADTVRPGRVLAWPTAIRPQSGWMRTAAAAAIVFVVAGGGWGVYTRVERNLPGKVVVMPARIIAPAGFSGASAVRTPQTLTGPTVAQPVAQLPAPVKLAKKSTTHPATVQGKRPAPAPAN